MMIFHNLSSPYIRIIFHRQIAGLLDDYPIPTKFLLYFTRYKPIFRGKATYFNKKSGYLQAIHQLLHPISQKQELF
ncbi:hypothetical protein BU200_10175 [Streptococcus acidominimus]|uniref:Uncharacterized protein n=1 Tax=Streptococcus acidominimus TaxID=1326 RepID=A0A1Q8E716_STRAI|nr:hypothetical protein BU200_10175 [Streptococcus acidominimus]